MMISHITIKPLWMESPFQAYNGSSCSKYQINDDFHRSEGLVNGTQSLDSTDLSKVVLILGDVAIHLRNSSKRFSQLLN